MKTREAELIETGEALYQLQRKLLNPRPAPRVAPPYRPADPTSQLKHAAVSLLAACYPELGGQFDVVIRPR